MFKRIENHTNMFDRYFKEADDEDGVSVTVAPRNNRGSDYNDENTNVRVAPRSNRGNDYTTGDSEDDSNDDDTESDNDTVDNDNSDNEDEDNTDNSDDTDSDSDDNSDENDDSPETDDVSDYSDDENEDDSDEEDSTDDSESSADSQKRYTMYLRYLRLYDVLCSMIEKLRYIVKDDPNENAVIIKIIDNFNNIKMTMFDYMVMKFKSEQYVEILIYFETIVNCIRLNFELIRNNKIILKQ